MRRFGFLGAMSLLCSLGALPLAGHDCCHHGHDDGCWNCGYHCGPGAARQSSAAAPLNASANQRALEGKITEVVYLPGTSAENGMVEVRIQSEGQASLVRLAPAGFLTQGGMRLREGDTVSIKGFAVTGMEGDLIVATEIHKGEKSLSLRDGRGRSTW